MFSGFNPCSFGCQSESILDPGLRPGYSDVSILVLLDVSLKEKEGRGWDPGLGLFQSLFFWMSV